MRWIAKILSLFVLLLLVVLSLVATIPLRFIVDHAPGIPLPVQIQIDYAQGTIVDGSLSLLVQDLPFSPNINSKLKTLAIAWRWCPDLDIGLSAICVEADTELVRGTLQTAISPVATKLYNVSLLSELKNLPVPIANNPMEISGDIKLNLSSLVIPFSASFPSRIQGELVMQDAVVGVLKLGNFYFNLNSNENREISANIKGKGELFSTQGIASLNEDGQYRYNIDVESGHTLVRNFLSQQGQINDKGGYRLVKTGVLPTMWW